jgi:putative peptide zinc metalloprotease protein
MARVQLHSEDWYRVSALCPRLRPQVQIALHDYKGIPWYVLTERSSGQTFRIAADDFEILRRFDGRTKIGEIWNGIAWNHQRDLPPQDEFLELLSRLYDSGIILVDSLPRAATLARGQEEKAREWITRLMKSPVSQKIGLFNPSAILEGRVMTGLAHLVFGPFGLILWLAAILGGVLTAISYWQPLTANVGDRVLEPGNLLIMACVYPAVKLIHELAHALAVRRFGGSVTQVGVIFLVFVPMPYVDASQANAFRSHGVRALVTAAGIMSEFAIAGVAMILWAEADPGLWRAILFNTILLCTVSTIFFNGNPLLRFDAYFVLADLTQTPALGTRGQRLLMRLTKRLVGLDPGPDTESGGTGERVWLVSYAIAAAIYRVFIVFAIAFGLAQMLGMGGQLLGAWVVIGGLIWPNIKALHGAAVSPEVKKRKWVLMRRLLIFGTAFLAVLAVIPFPLRTTVPAVVVPSPQAALYARGEGFVETLAVESGAQLSPGDLVMILDRAALATELDALEARRAASAARLLAARNDGETSLAQAIEAELDAIADGAAQIRDQLVAVRVVADRSGQWVDALNAVERGMMVTRGQQLGWILGLEDRRLAAHIPQSRGFALRHGVRGARLMVAPGDTRQIAREALDLRPDASRSLVDPMLADRMGGPVLTDLESPPEGILALNAAFQLVIDAPGADLQLGQTVLVKLTHPPMTLFDRYWPRIVTFVGERFGAGA